MKETKAMSYPCTSEVDSESTVVATLSADHNITANALFLNSKGEYWYRILCYGDTVGYIYAGDTEFISENRSDLRIEDSNAPSNVATGNIFVVKGTVKTTYNLLTGVSAYALSGFDNNGAVATGGRTAVNGYSFSLQGSVVDNALEFNKLSAGNYTYVIWCNVENHHAISGSEKTSSVTAVLIKEAYFTVGGNTAVYTVLYNGNGGSTVVSSQPKLHGTALKLTESIPVRDGYTFLGWSESATASSATYASGGSYTANANTTLYAVWKQNESTPEYALGDVNDDGKIDQYDYILVKRHYFETRILTEDEAIRADVNRDGKVDQYDYILIARHYFGTFVIS